MRDNRNESTKLMQDTPSSCQTNLTNLSKLLVALPSGGAQYASTLGLVAIYYYRGMWLVAPVLTGSMIAISDETLGLLSSRYPDNAFLKQLHDKTFFLNHGVGALLADFGFAWSTLKTIGVYIGGMDYASNNFGKILAPGLMIAPSIYSAIMSWKKDKGELEQPSLARHALGFFHGTIAPTGPLGILSQQGILSSDSVIPTSISLLGGAMGLTTSLVKESLPCLHLLLTAVIELLFRNASVAASFFHFPLDMYAATHEDEISDSFFFTMVGLTSLYFIVLTLNSSLNLLTDYRALPQNPLQDNLQDVTADRPSIEEIEDETILTRSIS